MEKKKSAQTLIEKFGFKDIDLTTPLHDEILLWLLNPSNMLHVLATVYKLNPDWYNFAAINFKSGNRPDCDWSWDDRCCTGVCFSFDSPNRIVALQRLAKLYHKETTSNPKNELAKRISIEAEFPILGYNNYNIGFVDVKVDVDNQKQIRRIDGITYEGNSKDCYFVMQNLFLSDFNRAYIYIEIKPIIKSIGELLRQISFYRSHVKDDAVWIVVTKTKGLESIFRSQTIHIYEWNGVIH